MLAPQDLENSQQTLKDLIFIQNDNLIKKIGELEKLVSEKLQSLENNFATIQDTLNQLMIKFFEVQEERHKEIIGFNNILNDHENRIKILEKEKI